MEIISEVHEGEPVSASQWSTMVRAVNALSSAASSLVGKLEGGASAGVMTHVQADHDFGAMAPASSLSTQPGKQHHHNEVGPVAATPLAPGQGARRTNTTIPPKDGLVGSELGADQYFFGDERNGPVGENLYPGGIIRLSNFPRVEFKYDNAYASYGWTFSEEPPFGIHGADAHRYSLAKWYSQQPTIIGTGGNFGAAPIAVADRHGGASLAGEHRLAYHDPVSGRNIFVDGPPKTYVCRVISDCDALTAEDRVEFAGRGIGRLQHIIKGREGSLTHSNNTAALRDSDAAVQFLNLSRDRLKANDIVQVAWYPIAWQLPLGAGFQSLTADAAQSQLADAVRFANYTSSLNWEVPELGIVRGSTVAGYKRLNPSNPARPRAYPESGNVYAFPSWHFERNKFLPLNVHNFQGAFLLSPYNALQPPFHHRWHWAHRKYPGATYDTTFSANTTERNAFWRPLDILRLPGQWVVTQARIERRDNIAVDAIDGIGGTQGYQAAAVDVYLKDKICDGWGEAENWPDHDTAVRGVHNLRDFNLRFLDSGGTYTFRHFVSEPRYFWSNFISSTPAEPKDDGFGGLTGTAKRMLNHNRFHIPTESEEYPLLEPVGVYLGAQHTGLVDDLSIQPNSYHAHLVDMPVTAEVGDADSDVVEDGKGKGIGLYLEFDKIPGWVEGERQILVHEGYETYPGEVGHGVGPFWGVNIPSYASEMDYDWYEHPGSVRWKTFLKVEYDGEWESIDPEVRKPEVFIWWHTAEHNPEQCDAGSCEWGPSN